MRRARPYNREKHYRGKTMSGRYRDERLARWSLAAVVATMVVWGLNFPFVKHVLGQIGVGAFLSDKFAGGRITAGYGDLLLIVAALCFSLYTVLAQPLTRRYGPLIVLSWTLLFAAPPILVATLPSMAQLDTAKLTPLVGLGLFWALVLSSFLGWLTWGWVNAVRGVARCAPFNYLMPPIAGFSAWLTLGEHFTWLKLAGAAVTMAGVAWAQFGAGRPPPREAAQPDSA